MRMMIKMIFVFAALAFAVPNATPKPKAAAGADDDRSGDCFQRWTPADFPTG
jgi:hypothetical protein